MRKGKTGWERGRGRKLSHLLLGKWLGISLTGGGDEWLLEFAGFVFFSLLLLIFDFLNSFFILVTKFPYFYSFVPLLPSTGKKESEQELCGAQLSTGFNSQQEQKLIHQSYLRGKGKRVIKSIHNAKYRILKLNLWQSCHKKVILKLFSLFVIMLVKIQVIKTVYPCTVLYSTTLLRVKVNTTFCYGISQD